MISREFGFTYFQQAGGIELNPNSLEITYGIERLAAFQDSKDSIYDLEWGNQVKYSELRAEEERQFSVYNFEFADIQFLRSIYSQYEKEAKRLIQADLYLPAFDYVLKCSHTFNLLDARKAVSVAERNAFMANMRDMAAEIARKYVLLTEGENEVNNE